MNNKIYLGKQWKVLKGMGYGLSQTTLTGQMKVSLQSSYDFAPLDRFMAELLDIDTQTVKVESNVEQALVERLLLWQSRLQQQHKAPVFERSYSRPEISISHQDRHFFVALPYVAPALTKGVLQWLVGVVNFCFQRHQLLQGDAPKQMKQEMTQLQVQLAEVRKNINHYQIKGINIFLFMRAADVLGIEVNHVAKKTIRFGSGQYSRLLESSFTDKTSVIGTSLAQSKSATALLLRNSGIPASVHFRVQKIEQLADCCKQIGFPIVVKPDNLEQGMGVFAHLNTQEQVLDAYKNTAKVSDNILLERHVKGDDYRITVLNNEVIKVVKRTAGGVIGDAKQTVKQLVEQQQSSGSLQAAMRQSNKKPLDLDDEALSLLEEQNLHQGSIPKLNEYVALRRKNNISTGGIATLVDPSEVHPDNLALAIRTAQALYLDLAGIDLLIPDIRRSWLESDAIICEVNAQPQIGEITTPLVYQDILKILMKEGMAIPLYLIICDVTDDEAVVLQIEQLMQKLECHARVSKEGLWLNGQRVSKAFNDGFTAIKAVIANTQVSSAVCTMTQQEVEDLGLPVTQFKAIYYLSDELFDAPRQKNIIDLIGNNTAKLELIGLI